MSFDFAHHTQPLEHAGLGGLPRGSWSHAAALPPEYRRITRIYLGSVIFGFALIGAAAWSIDTGRSANSAFEAETPDRPIALVVGSPQPSEANDSRYAPLSLDDASVAPPSERLRRMNERTDGTASLEPYLPAVPEHSGAARLPTRGSRTAVYDIAAHTVYMPNGQTLEAHSGLGKKRDNPSYVADKNQGPTPPNVYDLSLREKLFHKVRAIRLNPVGGGKMYGRDGMLAHTYMLGGGGQSNGCLVFKDYSAFLHAFLKGDVDRLVVVRQITDASWRTASTETGPEYLDTN